MSGDPHALQPPFGPTCERHPDHYAFDLPSGGKSCSACDGHPCCAAGRLHRVALDMVEAGDAPDIDAALAALGKALRRPKMNVTIAVGDARGGPPPGVPFSMVQEAFELGKRWGR